MTNDDYQRMFDAYVEYAKFDGEERDVTPPGAAFESRLSGCSASEARIFAQNYAYEFQNNQAGLLALRKKTAHCSEYVLVSTYSTQVVCKLDGFGTKAVVVDTPHRAGFLRWAAQNKVLAYASDLELLPKQKPENVLQVVF